MVLLKLRSCKLQSLDDMNRNSRDPFKCNEVKIADDGEILVKGENVMLGYWNNQNETEKVLKMDGYILGYRKI